ncbi:MAG: protein-glutamate O-methyltransferase CheR [Pseudomonadota bacterium]
MLDETFNELSDLALRHSGQLIPQSKSYLMEARLGVIARREGFGSLDDLAHCLRERPNPTFEAEVAAALLSQDTRFFRERETIETLTLSVLPARLKQTSNGKLRVWCAGGASGQEAYSIAMRIDEVGGALKGARIDILSTDLCKGITERARKGTFGHFEVQRGLSIQRLLNYFQRQETGDWRISDEMRSAISFRQHNLIDDSSGLGKFDVILCRHVLSGMDAVARRDVVERLVSQLLPGGVVMLGEGETLAGITNSLEPSMAYRGGWVVSGTAEREAAA